MKPSWEALAARARGLSTHLLREEKARAVEQIADVSELIRELRGTPYERWLPTHEGAPELIETAVARSLFERMSTLARWEPGDPRALRPLFLEQDARNVRAVVRGVVGGVTPERRLAGAIPTPLLDRRALEALARAESPGAVAATLVGWAHPFGSALLEEAGRTHPDLARLEIALARRLAAEALIAAKRSGGRVVEFVRSGIDADNVVTALLLAGAASEGAPLDYFIAGGIWLGADDFVRGADAADRAQSGAILARALRATPLAAALREPPWTPAVVAARILSARIEALTALGRVEPLSPVPVLLFVLRLRREAWVIRRALWRTSLSRRRA